MQHGNNVHPVPSGGFFSEQHWLGGLAALYHAIPYPFADTKEVRALRTIERFPVGCIYFSFHGGIRGTFSKGSELETPGLEPGTTGLLTQPLCRGGSACGQKASAPLGYVSEMPARSQANRRGRLFPFVLEKCDCLNTGHLNTCLRLAGLEYRLPLQPLFGCAFQRAASLQNEMQSPVTQGVG